MLTVPLTGFTLSQPAGSRRTAYLRDSQLDQSKVLHQAINSTFSGSKVVFTVHLVPTY